MADIQRQIPPIPDVPRPITYDAKGPDTSFRPNEPLLPPSGAPNIVMIMLDDVGYGATSPSRGPCRAPVFERLADGGLRFTRFHTTALCAPTRQALPTGRDHHSVGMGGVPETATSASGYNSIRPTGRPAGGGFEHFYGFVGGETNQHDSENATFTGDIHGVQLHTGPNDTDHFIRPRGAQPHRHGPAVTGTHHTGDDHEQRDIRPGGGLPAARRVLDHDVGVPLDPLVGPALPHHR
ncbi:sulfatase-like hydrolase/transferase [Streptomyces sp. NPDC051576]|uniref:sulfatase-like hydrolase/transferase n=1 Tax=Streptomyces sp. NPDC051576 TaxID=3155803 RepID=UPI00342EDAF4